jgi:hypothetical protein
VVNHEQEHQLLIKCAAGRNITDPTAGNVSRQEIDWDYFYCLARRHSLVPLVFRQLESIKDAVPAEVFQRFRKDFQENAARNLIFVNELTILMDRLANAGIDTIVFKGPALACALYGDLNLRRFIDLDLIVRRRDMDRAIGLLMENGYRLSRDLTIEQRAVLLRTQHNLQFTKGRVIVELHWQVSSELFASTVTAEDLWKDLSTVKINGRSLKTLSNDDLLFALCVHGSRHLWQRLAWICDIDRLIGAGSANWLALCERASRANAERMFLLGPALAAGLLGTDLPEPIATAIAGDRRISRLCDEIRARLFDGPEQSAVPLSTVIRFNLLIRSGWRSRFRYGRFLFAPTDSDLNAVRLRPRLYFMYYFLRPLRLLQSALRPH